MRDRPENNPYALPGYQDPYGRRGPVNRPRGKPGEFPSWLAARLLRSDEEVVWVTGPKATPWWERHVTHYSFFFLALAIAIACVVAGRVLVTRWSDLHPAFGMAAVLVVFGAVAFMGITSGYFTRLVVTNKRVFIAQGRELCRTWSVDRLPRHLVRYERNEFGEESRTVDVDAVKTMLDAPSEGFAESKTILAFGKSLDRIKDHDPDRR